jgi:hypothetical protein
VAAGPAHRGLDRKTHTVKTHASGTSMRRMTAGVTVIKA